MSPFWRSSTPAKLGDTEVKLKPGVSVNGLRPEMVLAAGVVEGIFLAGGYEVVITSGTDGNHSRGSRHYVGHALDFRTRHIPREEWNKLADQIRDALGPDFQLVIEKTHFHLEFDPPANRTTS